VLFSAEQATTGKVCFVLVAACRGIRKLPLSQISGP